MIDSSALILAGGLGTRLRSVVEDRPKVLAEVLGRPFLDYLLDQLIEAGVRHAVLCTGHMAEKVRAQYGDAYGPLELAYSVEEEPMGTGGALRLGRSMAHGDPLLVLNGDSFCHADLGALWERHRASGGEGTLLLCEVPDTSRYGRVEVDSSGCLGGFLEKGGRSEKGWINAGVYVLSQRLIEAIPSGRAVSLERDILTEWTARGGLFGHPTEGPFLDIGTPQSYAAAERFFADDSP